MHLAFYTAIETAYSQVAARQSACARNYTFADQPIHMEIIGQTLADVIMPPFAHLETHSDHTGGTPPFAHLERHSQAIGETPALHIRLWDMGESGVPCSPEMPEMMRGEGWQAETTSFFYSDDRRYAEYRFDGGMTWLDRETGTLYGCYTDARQLRAHERSRPLAWVLPLWYHDHGIQTVHAGFVSHAGHGILFAGKSGSGKTTASLACLGGGFDYLAEDQVGIREDGDGFTGYSFYNTARIDPPHLERFPLLARHASCEDGEKTLLTLASLFPKQLQCAAAVKLLLLPIVTDSVETHLVPATAAEALRVIAPNSITLPMGGGRRGFERLSKLVQRVPRYWLHMGGDLAQIPAVITHLLDT